MSNRNYFCLVTFAVVLFSFGCSNEKSIEECEYLAMRKFKGFPKESREFDDNCKNQVLFYNPEKCQEALKLLVMNGDLSQVQKQFGAPIIECFTENDLKLFNKK